MPASSAAPEDASPTAASAAHSSADCTSVRRRRSSMSPSGTTNSSASAQPSWVAPMTTPIAAWLKPKSAARVSSKGWA